MVFQKGEKNINWVGGKKILSCKKCGKEFFGATYRMSVYCSRECCNKSKLGISIFPNGRNAPWVKGSSNGNWKGESAGIDALHKRVYAERGKPITCEHCGATPPPAKDGRNRIHWANKSHEYKYDVMDFIALCVSCHRRYDKSYFNLHPHLRSTHE